jgi:hypothetical protein
MVHRLDSLRWTVQPAERTVSQTEFQVIRKDVVVSCNGSVEGELLSCSATQLFRRGAIRLRLTFDTHVKSDADSGGTLPSGSPEQLSR